MTLDGRFRVGRYDIFGLISAGGMARVHFGRLNADGGFGRIVAVKSIHRGLIADARIGKMLEDEARLLSKIHHPNVIAPIDVIVSDAELFLVLEYVPGATLSELFAVAKEKKEPLPIPVAVRAVADMLHGLHAAHELRNPEGDSLNVIHRDVSPENLLVGVDGVGRVFDFGIAKSEDRAQRTTEDGIVKGKLPYMAPEQLGGAAVDRRVDIYAAGVVLWEALAARRLFRSETPTALVSEVMVGATKPPSVYRSDVPDTLDAITMRALSLVPTERFESAHEMAIALEQAIGQMRPADLAEWVASFDDEHLNERAAKVQMIEQAPPLAEPAAQTQVPLMAAIEAPSATTRSIRRPLLIGAALFLVVAVAALVAVKEPAPDAKAPNSPANAATTPLAPAPSVAVPAVSAPPVNEPDPGAPSVRTARPTENRAPKSRTKEGCKVPYDIDANGHKVYRRECL